MSDLRKGMARHPKYGVTYRKRDFTQKRVAVLCSMLLAGTKSHKEIAAEIGCAKWSIKRFTGQLRLQGYDVPQDKAVRDHVFTRERAVEIAKTGDIEGALLEWTPDW
ncbi:MAG: hypothetical protein FKY71_20425, partial [Spiribacter salinus]